MNPDYYSGDLDALVAYIDKNISAVRTETNDRDTNIDALIRIVEITKKYIISIKDGTANSAVFLQNFLQLACISRPIYEHESRINMFDDPVISNGAIPPTPALIKIDSLDNLSVSTIPVPSPALPHVTVRKADGKRLTLGKQIGQGGEGSVYKIPELPGKVAKIFNTHKLKPDNYQHTEKKIRYLITKKDAACIGDTIIASLPEDLLYTQDGSLAGYIMPQFTTTTKLFEVHREGRRRKLFPDLDYRGLIVVAYNLAEAVDHLHSHEIVIGDMNPNNILVHADGTVGLLDSDSFSVTDPNTGEHFPCCVGLSELLAPELQMVVSLRNAQFTKESDNFSLAIHIFRLLMNNADPFGFKLTSYTASKSHLIANPQYNIANGDCAYVRDIPGKKIPDWSPGLDILPKDIQELFCRAFDYTAVTAAASVSKRPTAAEWMDALQRFYQMPLTRCDKDEFHLYIPSLTECPFCQKLSNTD